MPLWRQLTYHHIFNYPSLIAVNLNIITANTAITPSMINMIGKNDNVVVNTAVPNIFKDLIGVNKPLPKDINVLPIPFASSTISTNGVFDTIYNTF